MRAHRPAAGTVHRRHPGVPRPHALRAATLVGRRLRKGARQRGTVPVMREEGP